MKVVTEKTLLARVRRELLDQSLMLRICKESSPDFHDLGRYYVVSDRNVVVDKQVDLKKLGKKLGALKAGEQLQ